MIVATDESRLCHELAECLSQTENPESVLLDHLPCSPLDLMIALHAIVANAMLADLPLALRTAKAAKVVADRFSDDPLFPLLQAQAQWSLGSAIFHVPNYVGALEHYDAALAYYAHACQTIPETARLRDVRVIHVVRAGCLSELGRYPEALEAIELAKRWLQDHPHPAAQLTLLLNSSHLAGMMGDYVRMIELAQETTTLAQQLGRQDRVAQGLINRAYACIYVGRFAEAEEVIQQGIAIASAANQPITVARAQCNQAVLLRFQGQLFAALKVLRQAQRGLTEAEGEAATVALEEAGIYEQLYQLDNAQHAALRAAELFAAQHMIGYTVSAELQAVRLAVRQRRRSFALEQLSRVAVHVDALGQPVLEAELQLAQASLLTLPAPEVPKRTLQQLRREAYVRAQAAVAALRARELVYEAAAGQLIVAKLATQIGKRREAGAIYRTLVAHQDQQVRLTANAEYGALLSPSRALPYLRHAVELAQAQRRALPMEELQARYSSEMSPHHMQLAACYLALGDVDQAYSAVCTAKAGPLLDLRITSGMFDDDFGAEIAKDKATIARWRAQMREHRRIAYFALEQAQHGQWQFHEERAREAAARAQAAEQALTDKMRTLGDRGGQTCVPSAAEVRTALPTGSALLEYAQCGDDLIGFLVRRGQPITCRRLGSYRSLTTLLDDWNLVRLNLLDDFAAQAAQQHVQIALRPLWEMLIAPWCEELAACTSMLIAPWGALHNLPWAALNDGTAYLSDVLPFTLTPCGALWAAPYEAPLVDGPPRVLGYAGRDHGYLLNVEHEIAAITRHLSDVQCFNPAESSNLKALPTPRLLHIAAHGTTIPDAPLCSTLELADGPFLLVEAHRLPLRGTQLVVLSACETGARPDYGDMALALAGAFLCAGARAVLASLWPVSDQATAALMEEFYAALAAGAPPAGALRYAQRRVRSRAPVDWAAFSIWAGAA